MKVESNSNLNSYQKKIEDNLNKVGSFYESQFLKMMLDEIDKSQNNELLNGGSGEKIFKDMLNNQYAESISNGKDSIGIRDLIVKDLKTKFNIK